MAELYRRSWRAWRLRLKAMGVGLSNGILRRTSALHHACQPLRRRLAIKMGQQNDPGPTPQ